jgi:hypothetical protein
MKLAAFDGGLNTRIAPELIQPNEAIVCENVNLSSGNLSPSQAIGSGFVVAENKPYYFESNDEWLPDGDTRDYLGYQGNLFFSDGATAQKRRAGIWHSLGIVAPANAPSVVRYDPVATAALMGIVSPVIASEITPVAPAVSYTGKTGSYTYRFVYSTGTYSVYDPALDVAPIILTNQDASISKPNPVYDGYGNWWGIIKIYRKGGLATDFMYIGAAYPNAIGFTFLDDIPDTPNSINEIHTPGTIQYVYTYYNLEDGTESIPSPVSEEIVESPTLFTFLNATGSADPQVTGTRLYRVGGSVTEFTELIEPSNLIPQSPDRLLGGALTSELNGEAPIGLKSLTENNGTFFGVIGSKLYFTLDAGNPNYWPAVNYIDFKHELTGIGVGSNGIVVFSRYETYGLSGYNASTFVKYHVSQDQGCVNHKSIVGTGSELLFVSTDGICTYSGGGVAVASKFKLGKQEYDSVIAVMFDEAYYLQLADNSVVVLDLRYKPALYTLNLTTHWLVVYNDILWTQDSDIATNIKTLVAPFGDAPLAPFTYMTGNLTEGRLSELKTYNTINVYCIGDLEIEVFINDVLVITKELTGAVKPLDFPVPQTKQRGSCIRFGITGTGTLKELEYTAVGRENV